MKKILITIITAIGLISSLNADDLKISPKIGTWVNQKVNTYNFGVEFKIDDRYQTDIMYKLVRGTNLEFYTWGLMGYTDNYTMFGTKYKIGLGTNLNYLKFNNKSIEIYPKLGLKFDDRFEVNFTKTYKDLGLEFNYSF